MPQRIPAFELSDDAKRVRAFLYEHWCEHGRGPNLRGVHEATGLSRPQIVDAYKELELAIMLVADLSTQNVNVLKVMPFSSFPSQVEVWIDGQFHSYAGCAMESVAISKMPPFGGKEVRVESYCACCLAPVTAVFKDGDLLSCTPESTLIHVSQAPWDWGIPTLVPMCDAMNYVHDADHAAAYERTVARRGVLFTFPQAKLFVSGTSGKRMWDHDWGPERMEPAPILDGLRRLGIDVGNWEP
jgi:hypothetical protein